MVPRHFLWRWLRIGKVSTDSQLILHDKSRMSPTAVAELQSHADADRLESHDEVREATRAMRSIARVLPDVWLAIPTKDREWLRNFVESRPALKGFGLHSRVLLATHPQIAADYFDARGELRSVVRSLIARQVTQEAFDIPSFALAYKRGIEELAQPERVRISPDQL